MNILKCTIKMKEETQAHYERLAETVTNNELKQMFNLLAAAEHEHVDKLVVMKNTLGRMKAPDIDKIQESVCVYSPQIDPRHLAEALRHDPDAYLHVVKEEEDTIEFFDQLGDQAESDQLRRIFRLQAAREREHLEMLEHIYFFVEEPRTFLEWGEFSNLKSL